MVVAAAAAAVVATAAAERQRDGGGRWQCDGRSERRQWQMADGNVITVVVVEVTQPQWQWRQ